MTLNPEALYDHAFADDNVYGHALSLVRSYADKDVAEGAIHLDICCGYGRIAEPLVAEMGLTYVGIDADDRGLASLRDRGFETHNCLFEPGADIVGALSRIVGGRRIVAITMLDALEHLPEGDEVLRACAKLADEHNAPFVLSVPNIGHRDIGLKLALGRWDYTEQGLLDHTHVRLFDHKLVVHTLRRAGLNVVAQNHVRRRVSDQGFPAGFPTFGEGSLLARLLGQLRDNADDFADVTQFVVACVAGPRLQATRYIVDEEPDRPFLSIVTRSQGKRIQALVELFTCLAGQDSVNFEVVLVGHNLSVDDQLAVERVIADNPTWLREKIRLLRVAGGNRTRPLNAGFEAARGHYIAMLDDDDLPFGHWVSTFEKLAAKHPGQLVRAVTVRQNAGSVKVAGHEGLSAAGGMERLYPSHFDLLAHLEDNRSPCMSIAFPRGLFHELNIRFDEELNTAEDWDYIIRCAILTGVADTPAITSIYRWWISDDSSRASHKPEVWQSNHQYIHAKLDRIPIILPPGSARRLRHLTMSAGFQNCPQPAFHNEHLLIRAITLLESRSWRLTAPIRAVGRLMGKAPAVIPSDCIRMDDKQLANVIRDIESSLSWRLLAPIRAIRTRGR